MTNTRLLKVLCSKVGKASTERTGHLGVVDLISTIHVNKYTREQEGCASRTSQSTWHRLGSLVNQKAFKSDKDQGHTSRGTISRCRNNVIEYLLQWNTARRNTIRSSDSLNGVGSWGKV